MLKGARTFEWGKKDRGRQQNRWGQYKEPFYNGKKGRKGVFEGGNGFGRGQKGIKIPNIVSWYALLGYKQLQTCSEIFRDPARAMGSLGDKHLWAI